MFQPDSIIAVINIQLACGCFKLQLTVRSLFVSDLRGTIPGMVASFRLTPGCHGNLSCFAPTHKAMLYSVFWHRCPSAAWLKGRYGVVYSTVFARPDPARVPLRKFQSLIATQNLRRARAPLKDGWRASVDECQIYSLYLCLNSKPFPRSRRC